MTPNPAGKIRAAKRLAARILAAKSLAAALLLLAPLAATAQGCPEEAQASCAPGQHWDAKTKTCVFPSS